LDNTLFSLVQRHSGLWGAKYKIFGAQTKVSLCERKQCSICKIFRDVHFFGIIWSFSTKQQTHFLPADIQGKSHIDDKTPKIHRPNGGYNQGRVVRKLVNANRGLKVNRKTIFSCIKVLSIAYVLFSLRLLMLKAEAQKI